MNTPEENKNNLSAMKRIISEAAISLSVSWILYWILVDIKYELVLIAFFSTFITLYILNYLNLSLKSLYLLSTKVISIAILITILV